MSMEELKYVLANFIDEFNSAGIEKKKKNIPRTLQPWLKSFVLQII
jgi:hypothetical protein